MNPLGSAQSHSAWSNWVGNQHFTAELVVADGEEAVREAVRWAASTGRGIRVAGSGHSFTPVVEPRDVLLELRGTRGVASVSEHTLEAEVFAQSRLREIGPALWRSGMSLRNQGDTDGQTIAGATATGTKGSGRDLRNMSAEITSITLVDGNGEVHRLTDAQPEELRAARVSLGLMGIVTRIGLNVDPAYGLREDNTSDPLGAVLSEADDAARQHRHYSFCWCADDTTSSRFGLPPTAADHCYVKRLQWVPAAEIASPGEGLVSGAPGRRIGPAYAIYPDWDDQHPSHVELEYMVSETVWKAAFAAVRELITRYVPEQSTLVQVRWQAPDDSYLSAQYGRQTVSMAMVADPTPEGMQFLRSVHRVLLAFDARPHWGKMHFFDQAGIQTAFPALPEFQAVRERFDPGGTFLNPHLIGLLVGPDS